MAIYGIDYINDNYLCESFKTEIKNLLSKLFQSLSDFLLRMYKKIVMRFRKIKNNIILLKNNLEDDINGEISFATIEDKSLINYTNIIESVIELANNYSFVFDVVDSMDSNNELIKLVSRFNILSDDPFGNKLIVINVKKYNNKKEFIKCLDSIIDCDNTIIDTILKYKKIAQDASNTVKHNFYSDELLGNETDIRIFNRLIYKPLKSVIDSLMRVMNIMISINKNTIKNIFKGYTEDEDFTNTELDW